MSSRHQRPRVPRGRPARRSPLCPHERRIRTGAGRRVRMAGSADRFRCCRRAPRGRPRVLVDAAVTGVGMPDVQTFDRERGAFAGTDTDPTSRLLSVAEIQQALRVLRTRCPGLDQVGQHSENASHIAPAQGDDDGGDRCERALDASPPAAVADDPALAPEWITMVAAHRGAGASAVALAVSDAASAAGRGVHLVETAEPSRSGLVAAAASELGTDLSGGWRRGTRQRIMLDRRVGDGNPAGWPVMPSSDTAALTVIDLGSPAPGNLARLSDTGCRTVVVCHLTVPGVRAAEQLLTQLCDQPVLVAAIGARRWPGEVTASLGPRLRAMRTTGRVVTVPTDRHLQVTGLTHAPLPKRVLAAGRSLLALLEDDSPGAATQAQPSRMKGSKR
jgi:hypothetical protein